MQSIVPAVLLQPCPGSRPVQQMQQCVTQQLLGQLLGFPLQSSQAHLPHRGLQALVLIRVLPRETPVVMQVLWWVPLAD